MRFEFYFRFFATLLLTVGTYLVSNQQLMANSQDLEYFKISLTGKKSLPNTARLEIVQKNGSLECTIYINGDQGMIDLLNSKGIVGVRPDSWLLFGTPLASVVNTKVEYNTHDPRAFKLYYPNPQIELHHPGVSKPKLFNAAMMYITSGVISVEEETAYYSKDTVKKPRKVYDDIFRMLSNPTTRDNLREYLMRDGGRGTVFFEQANIADDLRPAFRRFIYETPTAANQIPNLIKFDVMIMTNDFKDSLDNPLRFTSFEGDLDFVAKPVNKSLNAGCGEVLGNPSL